MNKKTKTTSATITLPAHYIEFMENLQRVMPNLWNEHVRTFIEQCTEHYGTCLDEAVGLTVECSEWKTQKQMKAATEAVRAAQKAFLKAEGKTDAEIAQLELQLKNDEEFRHLLAKYGDARAIPMGFAFEAGGSR